jgi:hypothetical protein
VASGLAFLDVPAGRVPAAWLPTQTVNTGTGFLRTATARRRSGRLAAAWLLVVEDELTIGTNGRVLTSNRWRAMRS